MKKNVFGFRVKCLKFIKLIFFNVSTDKKWFMLDESGQMIAT